MTDWDDLEPYSVAHAIEYARRKLVYCDSMMAKHPVADMSELRTQASTFLGILEDQPRDPDRLRDLRDDLRRRNRREGTGWTMLMGYVEEYLERLQKGGG
jgi:hypothetical protein